MAVSGDVALEPAPSARPAKNYAAPLKLNFRSHRSPLWACAPASWPRRPLADVPREDAPRRPEGPHLLRQKYKYPFTFNMILEIVFNVQNFIAQPHGLADTPGRMASCENGSPPKEQDEGNVSPEWAI
jgi:hypothetical protein